jgi:predicted transcriptional regulator
MTTLTIPLSREAAERLQQLAEREGVSTEKLATAGLEDWLTRPRADFMEAARYVLKKNEELYRRLA